jgi:hypothetical protein
MYQKEETKRRILWGCDEEEFEKKGERKKYNVGTYFKEIYDVPIRFPNMPIVSTRKGYYPAEFLYQELSRVPNANEQEFVSEVLSYNDSFAGRDRIDHVSCAST